MHGVTDTECGTSGADFRGVIYMRLIDAESVERILNDWIIYTAMSRERAETVAQCVKVIDEASTVEVRHIGKWIDDGTGLICKCSVCGGANFGTAVDGYFKYCPDCGSDMRGWNG